MATYKLAVVVKAFADEEFFIVAKQTPPPMPVGDEYQQHVDSELWDLPSATLNPLQRNTRPNIVIGKAHSFPSEPDMNLFDVEAALDQALSQVGVPTERVEQWEYRKFVEEPKFGPGPPEHLVFIFGRLISKDLNLKGLGKWLTKDGALNKLLDVAPADERFGPLFVAGILSDGAANSRKWKAPSSLPFQEYPPGISVVPMASKTAKPFSTTNLVVMAPTNTIHDFENSKFVASADSVIMDPGCCSQHHSQLADIVSSLPKNLVVLVTHHHHDHVDGLSIVQKCNPNAILLAHENTMARIGKDKWSINCKTVSGGESICIAGHVLKIIFAPGHTDGHIGILHVNTNALIVGDHCVGQGSALLDITSGGNMKDYFQSTYGFMKLSPHVIIPMHGRANLWPKQMLCGYLKHRRDRESSILRAIANGAATLHDVVSTVYSDVDVKLWLHASSNVRIHVEYLAFQEKLPKEFSLDDFNRSHDSFVARLSTGMAKV